MTTGFFITFEGIDGAGKSSHIQPTAELLKAAGYDVVVTREPGGTPLAEKIRALVLNDAMDPMTEALLVFAARRDHIQTVIRPALAAGKIVLSDRFTDSTWAYQGYGRGFNHDVLSRLEDWVQRDHLGPAAGGDLLQPDATFLYDLDPAIAARRLAGAREPDRFESEKADFFAKVREGYLMRMVANRGRFYRLDASLTQEEVWNDVRDAVGSMILADQIVNRNAEKVA